MLSRLCLPSSCFVSEFLTMYDYSRRGCGSYFGIYARMFFCRGEGSRITFLSCVNVRRVHRVPSGGVIESFGYVNLTLVLLNRGLLCILLSLLLAFLNAGSWENKMKPIFHILSGTKQALCAVCLQSPPLSLSLFLIINDNYLSLSLNVFP